MSTVLVTGGAGYVGSTTAHYLNDNNIDLVVLDNLDRGHEFAVDSLEFQEGDLRNPHDLQNVFETYDIDAVLHFAAFALVGESMESPGMYYENNVSGTLNLLEEMKKHEVSRIVFSSSAAVYGHPEATPIPESTPERPINPYGRSKRTVELILEDYRRAYGFGYIALRYFNAAGAWPEKRLGEQHDPETHLIPNLLQSALQPDGSFTIYGNDFPTRDGTCVRDFVHIRDLASAHAAALERIEPGTGQVLNVGTGNGYSVQEVTEKAMEVTGREINVKTGERRPGDPPVLVAETERIQSNFSWTPRYSELDHILSSAWEWHKNIEPNIH